MTTSKKTLIDNTLTNSNIDLLNGDINTGISGHSVIFNILNIDKVPTVNREYNNIRNINENKINLGNLLNTELSNHNWENLFNISNPSLNCETFILEVDTIINKLFTNIYLLTSTAPSIFKSGFTSLIPNCIKHTRNSSKCRPITIVI